MAGIQFAGGVQKKNTPGLITRKINMADKFPGPDYYESADPHWADPRIQAIMRHLDDYAFDCRGAISPRPVMIRQTWNRAAAGFPALLAADEGRGCFTIVSHVFLKPGETLILEKKEITQDTAETLLCTIRDCRPGQRAQDQKNAVYISHLICKGLA